MKKLYELFSKFNISISLWLLNLLIGLLFVSVFNLYFWQEIIAIIKPESITDYQLIGSIILFLILVINLVFNLLTSQKTYKVFYVLVFTISAISFYYIAQYNIIIDKEMVRNVVETNHSEARDLMSFSLLSYLFVFGLIPILLILKTELTDQNIWSQLIIKIKVTVVSVMTIGLIVYLNYPSFASLARTNRHLSHMIVPTNFIFATISYITEQFNKAQLPFSDIAQDAFHLKLSKPNDKNVVILIVGETARADRFSINGYRRETNPRLEKRHVVNFKQTSSCGTSTAVSLPCLFSHLERRSYSHKVGKNSSNLLDFFKQAGIDVQWRDNNTGCKGICGRVDYVDFSNNSDELFCSDGECFDEILLKGLLEQINANPNDQFIVLHQKGSHGPAYYLRYPPDFKKFTPTCQSVQLQKCSSEALNNTYDNTIVYTDYFIDQTMKLLESLPQGTSSSLVYIADHGESLGENNLYLHGTPYLIAPESQTHVPFIYWAPHQTDNKTASLMSCLEKSEDHHLSHDHLFHSMLGLMNVSTSYYKPELDVFSSCHSDHVNSRT